jgi:basic membrane protein A
MRPIFPLLVALLASCSLFASSDIKGTGFGEVCTMDSDCHASTCDRGICVADCAGDGACPLPTKCFASKCEFPMSVTALHVGVIAGGEGWTLTHSQGLAEAKRRLPYINVTEQENVFPDAVGDAIDKAVAAGAQVIVSNSFSQRAGAIDRAEKYPNVRFLAAASFATNHKNLGSFTGREEQAWYVAGKIAANRSLKKRLGIIGALITPETVRAVNAFALGARAIDPTIKVEVQWIGFWYDYNTQPKYSYKGELLYREELLAQRMVDSGCDVIAHLADNQRSVRRIEKLSLSKGLKDVYSITNDNRDAYRAITAAGPGVPLQTCLGGPYWNWGPLYARLFDEIHRGVWQPSDSLNEPLLADVNESVVGFQVNSIAGVDDSTARSFINDSVTRGPKAVYQGPYSTTGQRDAKGIGTPDAIQTVAAGETISDKEWLSMCWHVEGVVTKATYDDVTSADLPAKVPDGTFALPPDLLSPPGAPAGAGLNCRENQ